MCLVGFFIVCFQFRFHLMRLCKFSKQFHLPLFPVINYQFTFSPNVLIIELVRLGTYILVIVFMHS